MPYVYTEDKNGRFRRSGGLTEAEVTPTAGGTGFGKPTPKRKPPQKPAEKPWWWHITPQGMSNNLRYEQKRLAAFNKQPEPRRTAFQRHVQAGVRSTLLGSLVYALPPSGRQMVMGATVRAGEDAGLALVNYAQRAAGNVESTLDRAGVRNPVARTLLKPAFAPAALGMGLFGPARDPEATPVGRVIVKLGRGARIAYGARLKEEMKPEDDLIEAIPAGFAANVAVWPLTAGAGTAIKGTGLAAKAARWGVNLAVNETAANLITDNTIAGPSQLLKAVGVPVPDALSADPARDDRISAGLREIPASMAIAGPLGAVLGAGAQGLGRVLENAPNVVRSIRDNRMVQELRNARRKTVENGLQEVDPATGEHTFTATAKTEPPPSPAPAPAAGPAPIPSRPPAGFEDFGNAQPAPLPQARQPGADPWMDDAQYQDWLRQNASREIVPVQGEAPAAAPPARQPLPPRDELRGEGLADPWGMGPDPNSPVQQALGQKPGAAYTGSPVQEPTPTVKESLAVEEEFYDPSLPEIDQAAVALERLEPDVIEQIVQTPGPVLPLIEEALANRQPVTPRPELSAVGVTAPTDKLAANPVMSRREEWSNLPDSALIGVFHPEVNPALFNLIESRTGRSFEELTRNDAIETLGFLEEQGATLMPDRLNPSVELARTADLLADPERFQYKLNTDRRGVQKGNSLEGLGQWNTTMEGVIVVWEDPANGKLYVVNGHNRLAKALELGIPTVPIKRLLASTAEQARALGALDNIASGGGTAWDAARFFRDAGMRDAAQAQAAGLPLNSGHAERGLQLAQLPDNIFQAGLTGELPEARALTLGGSGLSPEKMQAVWSEYQKDRFFRSEENFPRLIDIARGAPTTAADSGGRIKQGELPGLESAAQRDLTKLKVKLANKVKDNLSTDRRALKGAAKNADTLEGKGNSKIDAQTAMQAGLDAEQLGRVFDSLWWSADNEISALLNAGAEEIAAGAKVDAVARRIQGELAQAADKVMLPKPPEPAAPAPEAMAPELPLPRTEADLEAAKLTLLNRAAAGGEVRPSATPIPEPPQAPSVADLFEQVARDMAKTDAKVYRRVGEHVETTKRGLMELGDVSSSADRLRLAEQQRQAARDARDLLAETAWDNEIRRINQERLAADQARRDTSQTGLFGETEYDTSLPLLQAEEQRLAGEYQARDAAVQADMARAEREAAGYHDMTFEEKQSQFGITEGWEAPEVAPAPARPAAPTIKIPAKAAVKLTPQNMQTAAELLFNNANRGFPKDGGPIKSMEEALKLVQAKGKRLNTDAIPGLNIDQAMNDAAMGRLSPATEAVSEAYRQFYGVKMPDRPASGSISPMLASKSSKDAMSKGRDKLVRKAVRLLESENLGLEEKGRILEIAEQLDIANQRMGEEGYYSLGGVFTLGREGALEQIERDVITNLAKIMGPIPNRLGRPVLPLTIDFADYVIARDVFSGYGIDEIRVAKVNGLMADHLYSDAQALLLIARTDVTKMQGNADLLTVGVHEAVHWLQKRRMTQSQLEALTTDEAITWFQQEAAKSFGPGYTDLANIELQAWGTQRYLAAMLLDDMAALYRKEGHTAAAALLDRTRDRHFSDYAKAPTRVQEALKPLLELFERFKNYLIGAGFKLNSELSSSELKLLATFANNVYADTGWERVANIIYPDPLSAPPPAAVKEFLEAAYRGEIGQQMLLRPGRMGEDARNAYDRRWDLLNSTPSNLLASLSSVLREADGGKQKGVSKRALQLAEQGEPEQALKEATDYAQRRYSELESELESIKQRAIQEGC